ncbi:MAG TPA: hypothetical protein VLQ45_24805 [Thermoanaerobaculia bacterium]|nr:hypothetical protein [Thermoanaerobaculia bacterium]
MSKNRRFVVRLSLLGLALVLTLLSTSSPTLAASCSPAGALRAVVVNPTCCGPTGTVRVTKQNQVCSTCCGWLPTGGTYCANHNVCAI